MTTATTTKARGGRKLESNAEIRVRLSPKNKQLVEILCKRHGLPTGDGLLRIVDSTIKDGRSRLARRMSSHIPSAKAAGILKDTLTGRSMTVMMQKEFSKFLDEACGLSFLTQLSSMTEKNATFQNVFR